VFASAQVCVDRWGPDR